MQISTGNVVDDFKLPTVTWEGIDYTSSGWSRDWNTEFDVPLVSRFVLYSATVAETDRFLFRSPYKIMERSSLMYTSLRTRHRRCTTLHTSFMFESVSPFHTE